MSKTSDHLYTTQAMMRILGIQSRQTLYSWQCEPSHKSPGKTGGMWWSRERIEQIAAEHDRTPDWTQA